MTGTPITMARVIAAIGANARKDDTARMVKALKLHPWLNTAEETERLACGELALAHWSAYQRAAAEARATPRR